MNFRAFWVVCLALSGVALPCAEATPATGTVLLRHAPTLNGLVDGSVEIMTAEAVTFNGVAGITGALRVPGTPTVRLNGRPTFGGTVAGSGATTPTNYTITLNGGSQLGQLVTCTNPPRAADNRHSGGACRYAISHC